MDSVSSVDMRLQTPAGLFSLRVAGIVVCERRVLLQRVTGMPQKFAFPGGHVNFGEDTRSALEREFLEETGARVAVGALRWIQENFFAYHGAPCHQLCLFYETALPADAMPVRRGSFAAIDPKDMDAQAPKFLWVDLENVQTLALCPAFAKRALLAKDAGIRHFITRETA